MKNVWPMVALGQVLKESRDAHVVEREKSYPNFGIYSYARGLFIKLPIDGMATSASTLYRARRGQFVYSRLFAFEGAYGVIPAEMDGYFVSNEFPLFDADERKLSPAFLHRYISIPRVWREIAEMGTGVGDRRQRVRPEHLLSYSVPLPPIAEQQRIVARIEELGIKVTAAERLRREADAGVNALLASAMSRIWGTQKGWNSATINALASTVSGQVNPATDPFASLPHINGESMESGTCRLLNNYRTAGEDGVTSGKYHFRPGAVLYSKIRPYLRKAVHVKFEGVCSADVYAFGSISPALDRKFFAYSLIAPPFTAYANRLSGRTRMPKLNQNQMFAFELQFPPLHEQRLIVAKLDGLTDKVDAIKRLRPAGDLRSILSSMLDRAFRGTL